MVNFGETIRSKLFWLKILELFFSVLMIALVADHSWVSLDMNRQAVIYGTVIGFIMINTIVILTIILNNQLSRTIMLIINPTAALLFLISGGFVIDFWTNTRGVSDNALGSGIIGILNGVVYLVDTVLTFLNFLS